MTSCEVLLGAMTLVTVVRGDASSTSHVSISLGKSSVAYKHDHQGNYDSPPYNHDQLRNHDHLLNHDHLRNHDGPPSYSRGLEHVQVPDHVHVPDRSYHRGPGQVDLLEEPFPQSVSHPSFGSSRPFSLTPFIHSTPSPSNFEHHDRVHLYSVSSPSPYLDSFSERFHYPSFSFSNLYGSTPRPNLGVSKTGNAPFSFPTSFASEEEKSTASKPSKPKSSEIKEKEEQKSSEGSNEESVEKETEKGEENKENEPEKPKDQPITTSKVNPKVFHPSEIHASHQTQDHSDTLRIPKRPFHRIHQPKFLSARPYTAKSQLLEHKLKYNSESRPDCAKDQKDYCLEDNEYPVYEILNAAYEHSTDLLNLYADVADLNTEISVELPEKADNHESYVCPANVTYEQVFRAKNVGGRWRFIVNNIKLHYQTLTQTVRLEECLLDGENCPMVPHCYGSKCVQKAVYHRFLVYDPYDSYFPFLIESFKVPASCACHLGEYELEH